MYHRLSVAALQTPIHAVLVPFSLEDGIPTNPPKYLSNAARNPLIVLSASFTKNTPAVADALEWALSNGFSVDIDVQTNLKDSESEWEALEELFSKAMPHEIEGVPKPKGKVVLCMSFISSLHSLFSIRFQQTSSLLRTTSIFPS